MTEEITTPRLLCSGEQRKLEAGIALDQETLETAISIQDSTDPDKAWFMSPEEALRMATTLQAAAATCHKAKHLAQQLQKMGTSRAHTLIVLTTLLEDTVENASST